MKKRIVWEMFFVGAAITVGILFSAKTIESYRSIQNDAQKKQDEMNVAEQERERLLNQKARLSSPAGREQLAREQGYTKPNEKPLQSEK